MWEPKFKLKIIRIKKCTVLKGKETTSVCVPFASRLYLIHIQTRELSWSRVENRRSRLVAFSRRQLWAPATSIRHPPLPRLPSLPPLVFLLLRRWCGAKTKSTRSPYLFKPQFTLGMLKKIWLTRKEVRECDEIGNKIKFIVHNPDICIESNKKFGKRCDLVCQK